MGRLVVALVGAPMTDPPRVPVWMLNGAMAFFGAIVVYGYLAGRLYR